MSAMPKMLDTVVLPVAGIGSRMLPLTSAIEKCMLPAAGRPVIDYAVQECQKAGIKRVIFVCSARGEQQLRDYFGELNSAVAAQLTALGQTDLIRREQTRRQAYGITFEYIRQEPNAPYGYGTAVPLYLAKEALAGAEHFAYFMGDDIVFHAEGTSELGRAIEAWQGQSSAAHIIMSTPVSPEQASRYAVLSVGPDGLLAGIAEKPPASEISGQPLANIGRYIFSASIWQYLDAEMQRPRVAPEEHFLTTFVIQPALEAGQGFYVHQISGVYLDGGSPAGLAAANAYIAKQTAVA